LSPSQDSLSALPLRHKAKAIILRIKGIEWARKQWHP
jgi:hypothetical protein